MAGDKKFGYIRLSEGTEGEDGSLSSGSSWLEVLCEWRWKLTTDCFVCEKSGKVISCYGSAGRWWRRTEERMKCSEEITRLERCWLFEKNWPISVTAHSQSRLRKWLPSLSKASLECWTYAYKMCVNILWDLKYKLVFIQLVMVSDSLENYCF